jgi:hypothetical protein
MRNFPVLLLNSEQAGPIIGGKTWYLTTHSVPGPHGMTQAWGPVLPLSQITSQSETSHTSAAPVWGLEATQGEVV